MTRSQALATELLNGTSDETVDRVLDALDAPWHPPGTKYERLLDDQPDNKDGDDRFKFDTRVAEHDQE